MKQYPDYLVHFNKNHSKANGQFVSGDGDGDGVINDHANQKKQLTPEEKKKRAKRNAWIAVGAGAAGTAMVAATMFLTSKKDLTVMGPDGKPKTISTPRGKQMAWGFINRARSIAVLAKGDK